jgi:hypothetical protein
LVIQSFPRLDPCSTQKTNDAEKLSARLLAFLWNMTLSRQRLGLLQASVFVCEISVTQKSVHSNCHEFEQIHGKLLICNLFLKRTPAHSAKWCESRAA